MNPTNIELWNEILNFNLDLPVSEYGISTRLSDKNNWTINFTQKAILEYRKYIYLAATSDEIVSPSEIVDEVWHTHLMFTKSYQKFCSIFDKFVHHIPTTFMRKDKDKFDKAKLRTKELYQKNFGDQPKDIWQNEAMINSLELETFNFNETFQNTVFISIFFVILFGINKIFQTFIVQIENPLFLVGYIFLIVVCFLILEVINSIYIKNILVKHGSNTFLSELAPFELIYLKSKKISRVINGITNQLIIDNRLVVNSQKKAHTQFNNSKMDLFEFQVFDFLNSSGKTNYLIALEAISAKPIFKSIANNMDLIIQIINKSKKFMLIYGLNIFVFMFLIGIGVVRFYIGQENDKPIGFLLATIILALFIKNVFLKRLNSKSISQAILSINPLSLVSENLKSDWKWDYYINGESVYCKDFMPLYNDLVDSESQSDSWSSCGSGSSDGGDGGDGGGCGGCGGD